MSGGEQLRDYLPVEEASRLLAMIAMQDRYEGIVNICSGKPVSVRRLVEERIALHGGAMRLNLGALPYPEYEPMAYWGDAARLRKIVEESGLADAPSLEEPPSGTCLRTGQGGS